MSTRPATLPLTTAEAADYLGVTPGRIRAYIAQGRLAAIRPGNGRDWRINMSDLKFFHRRPSGRPVTKSNDAAAA